MQKSISTFIINLKKRTERKTHILEQFDHKPEFNVHIVEAVEHENGATGLWNSIRHILENLVPEEDQFVIISEDDHLFSNSYNKERFFEAIQNGERRNADILLGGVSWFTDALQLSEDLFWVDKFSGTQFFVIYRKFFKTMLEAEFTALDSADYKMAALTRNKLLMYPFISTQKEFGYSDINSKNNAEGYVTDLFNNAAERLMNLNKVIEFYEPDLTSNHREPDYADQYEDIVIPVYMIRLLQREDRSIHIEEQFKDKKEFELNITAPCAHEIEAVGLWQSITDVIRIAIEKDEDVIIICQDDHAFTTDYSKEYLFKNIIEGAESGMTILSGGVSDFKHVVPMTSDYCWIDYFTHSHFTVVYRSLFLPILEEAFSDQDIVGAKISEMTSHKILLYPFIAVQKDFGDQQITEKRLASDQQFFGEPDVRLKSIYEARDFYRRELPVPNE